MRVPLIEEPKVAEGGAEEVDFFGRPVLVLRHGGRVRAFLNVCSHLGGPLALEPDGEHLRCQWHGACFDARSGGACGAPAPAGSRLIRLPIVVEGGQITYVYGESGPAAPPTSDGPEDEDGEGAVAPAAGAGNG